MTIVSSAPAGVATERRDRWSSVGHSRTPEPRTAVAEAVAALDLPGQPALVMAYASATFDPDAVAAALGDLLPGVPLIGCSTSGEISRRGVADESVLLVAVGGGGMRCATALEPVHDGDVRTAAATAALCAGAIDRSHSTVLVILADGTDVEHEDIVRGAYDSVGPSVPLVGGCAGGGTGQRTALFATTTNGCEAVPGAVAVAAITSDGPVGIGVGHSWRTVGDPLVVTSSAPRVVVTLGERPALDVYLDAHGLDEATATDPDAFEAFALSHPLGIARRDRIEPRAVLGCDVVQRTLLTAASVPQGGLLFLMDGDRDTALEAVDLAVGAARDALGDHDPVGLVVFDCGARRGALGEDGTRSEVERLTAGTACPVGGWYTWGEIARPTGTTGFHTQTVVVLALG